MKALVFGGTGRIGSAVAWDLARYGGADFVGIAGRSHESLQKRGIVVVERAKEAVKTTQAGGK
ncbi:MAG: hypothetical protein NTV25_02390 [Methanothrix sp.]|nr:hypothetical protein [Methanothrix sp.]